MLNTKALLISTLLYSAFLCYAPQIKAQNCSFDLQDAEVCTTNSYQNLYTIVGPDGFEEYLWSTGETTKDIELFQNYTSSGNYILTATNASNCSFTDTATIVINEAPEFQLQNQESICDGENLTLCAPAGYSSYSWNNEANAQCISVNTPGFYSCAASNYDDECIDIYTATSTIYEAPIFELNDITVCESESPVLLEGPENPSYYYLWSTGEITKDISVTLSGVYTLTVTDSVGCSYSEYVLVIINEAPEFDIEAISICSNSIPFTICVPTGYTSYMWNNGASGYCYNVTNTSILNYISCRITNAYGCVFDYYPNLTLNEAPEFDIEDVIVCESDLPVTVCAPAGFNSYSYENNPAASGPCLTFNQATTMIIHVTDFNGCTAIDEYSVIVIPDTDEECVVAEPEIEVRNAASSYNTLTKELCSTIQIKTTSAEPVNIGTSNIVIDFSNEALNFTNYTPLHFNGDDDCINGVASAWNAQQVSPSNAYQIINIGLTLITPDYSCPDITDNNWTDIGELCFTVIDETANCNIQFLGSTVFNSNSPNDGTNQFTTLDLNENTANTIIDTCNESAEPIYETSYLCASLPTLNLALPETENTTNYQWSNGATAEYITIDEAGVYSLSYQTENGCIGYYEVVVEADFTFELEDIAVCEEQVPVVISGPEGYNSYQWSTGATSRSIPANSSGELELTISDENGCQATSTMQLTINADPVINFYDLELCENQLPYELSVSDEFESYNWSNGETGNTVTIEEGTSLSLMVVGSNGCDATETINITVNTDENCIPSNTNGNVLNNCKQQFKVYPTVTNSQLNIDLPDCCVSESITIYDTNGKLIRSLKTENNTSIVLETSELSKGQYFVQAVCKNGVVNKIFFKF